MLKNYSNFHPSLCSSGPDEHCDSTAFRPSCGENEAIIMLSASYGRIKPGKCLSGAFGHMGCKFDVLAEMDAFCSGKRSCEVKVDDSSFPSLQPCHKELKSSLFTTYKCVPGTVVAYLRHDCHNFCDVHVTNTAFCIYYLLASGREN